MIPLKCHKTAIGSVKTGMMGSGVKEFLQYV